MPRSRSNSKDNISIKAPPPSNNSNTLPSNNQVINSSPSFLSTLTQGFAFGTGSTIARNIFSKTEEKEDKSDIVIQKKDNDEKISTEKFIEKYKICIEKIGSHEVCNELLIDLKK